MARKQNGGARKRQEKGNKRARKRARKEQEKGKKRARKGQEKLLALIKANPYISVSSIAKECGMSVKTIRNLIDELREYKQLERIGPAKGGYWKVSSDKTMN